MGYYKYDYAGQEAAKKNNVYACPECGARLDARVKRKMWQRLLFPGSQRFECQGCGTTAVFLRSNKCLSGCGNATELVKDSFNKLIEFCKPHFLALFYHISGATRRQ